MIGPEIETALNDQLNHEQTAAHAYLSMAAWFDSRNLAGFAAFMRRQAEEERAHAMKFFDHITARGGTVRLAGIAAPPVDFDSPVAAFEAAFELEKANTRAIHALHALAVEHKDQASLPMLHWFIDEQVEEEQWCEEAVALLEMAGDDSSALLMLDQRYGTQAASEVG